MQSTSEIDFFALASILWRRKRWIAAGTAVIAALAAAFAWTREDVYASEAVIAPKEGPTGSSQASSLLGGVGGLSAMALQLGMGNANLDRLEIILKSRELALSVIENNDLLPALYPEQWDVGRKAWIQGAIPDMKRAAEALRSSLEVRAEPKRKLMRVVVYFRDSTLAASIATAYLEALKARIQEDTRQDAEGNRLYLEGQLAQAQDPLLRSGIQNLIAMEIEKSMIGSTRAFDILERPAVPRIRVRPNRKKILLAAIVAGIAISSAATLAHHVATERRRLGAGGETVRNA